MKAAPLGTALLGFVSLACSTESFKGVDEAELDADAPEAPAPDARASEMNGDADGSVSAEDEDADVSTPLPLVEAGFVGSAEASVPKADASADETTADLDASTADTVLTSDGGSALDAQSQPSDDSDGGSEAGAEPDAAVTGQYCMDAGGDAAASCVPGCRFEGTCEDSDADVPATECRHGESPCSTLEVARLTSEHIVDGEGDEFCDVPAFELNFSNAARGAADLPQTALARVAWSPEALHLFAEVSDPEVATNSNIDWLWDGDTVELYVATREASELSGFFTGRIDGVQLVFAPPSAEHPARAARLFWLPNNDGSWRQVREEVTQDFSAQLTADGYSIEAKLPWSKFGPRTPDMTAGMAIAFNLALSTASAQSLLDGGREGAALLYVGDAASGVATCDGEQMPWCNSTTWCSPVLQ